MMYEELNQFIYNYLEYDYTYRAIMLTGNWGTGKSYYVKNYLQKFLNEKKIKCTIVSLYGMKDINDISKSIYLESRKIVDEPKGEGANTAAVVGKIVGKTVLNGIVSKIGFDIGSVSDEDLKKVYESIDLSNRLIVLDDLERSKLDVTEILGYVNNLCEHDHAKVMLVTNEEEFIKTKSRDKKYKNSDTAFAKGTVAYLRNKEKTIGDTIRFSGAYFDAIPYIINEFAPYMNKFNNNGCISEILEQFSGRSLNLRDFIFACQKTKDILIDINEKNIYLDNDTEKLIFYSIIGFTQKFRGARHMRFEGESTISATLGANEKYPLFRFCYDYIVFQRFSDAEEIKKSTQYYFDYCKNGKWNSGKDKDLNIIKNYMVKTEKEVKSAIDRIPQKLKEGKIPYIDYGILANYLVIINYDVGITVDIDGIERIMVDLLMERKNPFEHIELFIQECVIEDKEGTARFTRFKYALENAMADLDNTAFEYNPLKVADYCKKRMGLINAQKNSKGIPYRIVPNKFVDTIKACDPYSLNMIRMFIKSLYNGEDYLPELMGDYEKILELMRVEKFSECDKIQQMQIRFIKREIDNSISRHIGAHYQV